MKYEMIFGDQSLFDGAPDDVDMIGYPGMCAVQSRFCFTDS